MVAIIPRLLIIALFGFSATSNSKSPERADLAAMLCQDEYRTAEAKLCQGLLIGTIDSLMALGRYCPDGATSYGYIIDTWHRLLDKDPSARSQPTIFTLERAIKELGLDCRR